MPVKQVFAPVCFIGEIPEGVYTGVMCGEGNTLFFVPIVFPEQAAQLMYTAKGEAWAREIALRLGIAFKRKIPVSIAHVELARQVSPVYALSRAYDGYDDTKAIDLYIPRDFLSFLLGKHFNDESEFESAIATLLRDGFFLFPSAVVLVQTLEPLWLEKLFEKLRTKKLLSAYQLALLCLTFPEYSLKIKHALSKNVTYEVAETMRRISADISFSERDIVEGVYSIEEAIFHLINAGEEIGFSGYLREIKNLSDEVKQREIFMLKSFPEWIDAMEGEGLLFNALCGIDDETIAMAFYDNRLLFEGSCGKCLSKRRCDDVRIFWNREPSFSEKVRARARIVSSYRELRVKKRNWGAEGFDFIIRGISDPASFRTLLIEVGWFTLSTALKNARRDITDRVVKALPRRARYLIEDVLRGVLNPNILHDELQIHEARARCVRKALELYEKGAIRLVL